MENGPMAILGKVGRGWMWAAVTVLLLILLAGAVLAVSPGDLDSGFGTNGLAYTDIGTATGDKAFAVAVQTDTKVIVAGSSQGAADDDFAVVRYTSAGGPDSTFGTSSIVTTSIGISNDIASAVVVQEDGKIVVAGATFDGVDWNFALVRYTDVGALDTTFNSTGIVTLSITAGDDLARAVLIQPDGKIVAVGEADDDFVVVRFKTDGSLDTSGFGGGDGIVTTDLSSGSPDRAFAVALQPDDGKLLVAGYSDTGGSEQFALARYDTGGSLDTDNFGSGKGWVATDFSGNSVDQAYSVDLQTDGRIILGGFVNGGFSDDFALACYLDNGTLDATFGAGGKVITVLSADDDQAYSVAVQPTGKIVLAGFTVGAASDQDYAVVRYTVTGTLDISFGATGVVTTDLGTIDTVNTSADEAYAMALQADNKIVVAGFSDHPDGNDNFGVVRYQSPNAAPVITDVAKAGLEDADVGFATADFSTQFDDDDGDVLTKIQVTSLPLGVQGVLELDGTPVTLNQEVAAANLDGLVFVPTADWSGVASFGWNGSDGITYATTSALVNLTLDPVNDVPSFAAGANQTVDEDAGPQLVAGWASSISAGPANEVGQVLTLMVSTGNDALFASLPAIDVTTGDLAYTPGDDLFGSAPVTVTLEDDSGTANGGQDTSLPQTFTIVVEPVNDAPSFAAGTGQEIDEDAGPQLVSGWANSISAGPVNEVGQVLTFTLRTDNDSLFASLPAIDASTGDLTFLVGDNLYGGAIVTVTLSDDGGTANGGVDTSPLQILAITVRPVNDAPVVSDVAKVGLPDLPLLFAAGDFVQRFVDVDGDNLTQIQVLSLPAHGSLELDGVPVVVGQVIPIAEVDTLAFVPDAGWQGASDFGWNGSDGTVYSPVGALVNIRISLYAHRVYLPMILANH